MSEAAPILSERRGAVLVLTLNRPAQRNALNRALTDALDQAVLAAEADETVRAILLTGGPKVFAAGADIAEMRDLGLADVIVTDFIGSARALAACRKPVVAAVCGYALGGGCEIAEMCDIVIAGRSARFGHPEVTLATMSGAGGTQRLAAAVGRAKAMDWLMTCRMVSAEEAERAGLVSRVVEDDQVEAEASAVAERLAALSQPVLQLIKRSAAHAAAPGLAAGLAMERSAFHATFGLDDRAEGMQAFLEKRQPRFLHR
jgi:enoyl-CoA hydratase